MTRSPSLMMRLTIGKTIGFVAGLFAFFGLPFYVPDIEMLFRLGVLFWLTLTGGFVGLLGVVTYHPVLHIPLPWWLRGPAVGAAMMLVLWMVASEKLDALMVAMLGADSMFAHGAWIAVDGAILGLIIAAMATYFGGEGKMGMEQTD